MMGKFNEETTNNCLLFPYSEGFVARKHKRFLAALLRLQDEAKYEELGDQLRDDHQALASIAEEISGEAPEGFEQPKTLSMQLRRCLAERYMGTCQFKGQCTGSDEYKEIQEIAVSLTVTSEQRT